MNKESIPPPPTALEMGNASASFIDHQKSQREPQQVSVLDQGFGALEKEEPERAELIVEYPTMQAQSERGISSKDLELEQEQTNAQSPEGRMLVQEQISRAQGPMVYPAVTIFASTSCPAKH